MAKTKRSNGAVLKARKIFNKHPKAERAEVLALCAKAGLNPSTSKTQYQKWMHLSKAERERLLWELNGEKKKEESAAQS